MAIAGYESIRPFIAVCKAWHRQMRLFFLAQLILLRLRKKFKKTPAPTLPQARQLIEWNLPEPKHKPEYVLIFVPYHQQRNYQAYLSHRKRRLRELEKWKSLKMSL